MGVRLWNWIAAIALTAVLMALAVPRSQLFSGNEWRLAVEDHPWVDYIEIPFYLLGILAATLVFALLGALLLNALGDTPPMLRAVRGVLNVAAIFGLSPLQPVFANVVVMLMVPTLAGAGLLPLEGLTWIFTTALVILFGITLGADLALRIVDNRVGDARGWARATAQTFGAQSPALAGRIAVIIMAGPLLMTAIASLNRSPSEVVPDASRFAFPVEGIIVGLVAALLGLGLWLLSRRVGGRMDSPNDGYPEPSTARQVVTWGLVALAVLVPILLLPTTGDPLVQRIDDIQTQPSSEHPFGTDQLGRDIYDRLIFAWRDTVYAGFAIGVVLFGLGIFWRLITPFNRSLVTLEPILERMPPAVIFFGLWGAMTGITGDSTSIRTIGIASGVILAPMALAVARQADLRAMPAVFAGLIMLGTLLVIGWSAVLGQIGLLSPPFPNFGEMLSSSRQFMVDSPWIADFTALVLAAAVLLPLIALAALSRCYGISRELIRLRG